MDVDDDDDDVGVGMAAVRVTMDILLWGDTEKKEEEEYLDGRG